jgi:hypothetical protein
MPEHPKIIQNLDWSIFVHICQLLMPACLPTCLLHAGARMRIICVTINRFIKPMKLLGMLDSKVGACFLFAFHLILCILYIYIHTHYIYIYYSCSWSCMLITYERLRDVITTVAVGVWDPDFSKPLMTAVYCCTFELTMDCSCWVVTMYSLAPEQKLSSCPPQWLYSPTAQQHKWLDQWSAGSSMCWVDTPQCSTMLHNAPQCSTGQTLTVKVLWSWLCRGATRHSSQARDVQAGDGLSCLGPKVGNI